MCIAKKDIFVMMCFGKKSKSHNTGTSHWLDPRLARVRKHSLGECGEDELPYGWERVTDERYGSYYVDHINRRTQYENPVLQARLRAKNAAENNANNKPNGGTPTGELRGERFTLSLTKGTQGLGFTLIGAEGIPETEGYLQIRSIVPHSPAWIDGALRPGDVVVGVNNRAVRGLSHAHVAQIFQSIAPGSDVTLHLVREEEEPCLLADIKQVHVNNRAVRGLSHAHVAQIFQSIAPGSDVTLHLVRGYPLSFDSEDPNTRVLSTLAVDATTPATSDAVAMQQLTRALRTRFNLDSPNHVDPTQGRDETDNSPVTPHSPTQRRLMSRSFDLDAQGPRPFLDESEGPPVPRCPSADHLLSLATGNLLVDAMETDNSHSPTQGRLMSRSFDLDAQGPRPFLDESEGPPVPRCPSADHLLSLATGNLLVDAMETDNSHSPTQGRLMSRSFDLDAQGPRPFLDESEGPPVPRCPSADHLLSLATEHQPRGLGSEAGRELLLTLRRGAAGFGFTIADSVHGQKVKKVLDRSRCAGLREGDLLLQIGDTDVRHSPHQHVVQVLKECPAMHETTLRVWRRNTARAPRSRSATRLQPAAAPASQLGRSKTPTAEQLRAPLHAPRDLNSNVNALDEMNSVDATYAVPDHKGRERESLIDRRRRSSTPGGRLTLPGVAPWSEPQDRERESLIDRRRRSSTPGGRLTLPGVAPWSEPQENQWQERETWVDNSNIRNWAESAQKWGEGGNGNGWAPTEGGNGNWAPTEGGNGNWANGEQWPGNWAEVPTPTVHVDMNAAYWRGNASVADSSDNGGFPEDGMLHSPTTAAIGGLSAHRQSPSTSRMRPHSPSNSTGRLRSHSPSNTSATDHLLAGSPSGRLQSRSPSNNSCGRIKGEPLRPPTATGRLQSRSPSNNSCGRIKGEPLRYDRPRATQTPGHRPLLAGCRAGRLPTTPAAASRASR
ncbi:uncharacterized protein LOC135084068 [Ostrinia nubilalis]|uniref:uncharacterized protein LOC135084068 n=1 Tax=Ostrinia nubilalis TaxID=29057 RepID=UPI0030823897